MTNYDHLFNLNSIPIQEVLDKMGHKPGELKNKVAVVTGSGRGIGEQTAKGLAYLGAKVVIVDILDSGAKVKEDIQKFGGEALFIQKDLSLEQNVYDLIETVKTTYGKIDIYINNAVSFDIYSLLEMSVEQWDYTQNTNIRSAMIASKLILPDMIIDKDGIIVNMVALEGMAYASDMSASKVSLRSLLMSLSAEVKQVSGVSIFGFAPGLVATPLVADVFPRYCKRIGIDFQDYVLNIDHNPGYDGLMPPEHCAGGLICSIRNAKDYHGLIADPHKALRMAAIPPNPIPKEEKHEDIEDIENVSRLKEYIYEVRQLNENIEATVKRRTSQLREEQEKTKDLLIKSAHLAAIVKSSNDAIIRFDHDGYLTSWNKGAEHLLGYTEREILGRHISLIIPVSLNDETKMLFSKVKKGEVFKNFETTRVHKNGRQIEVSVSISSVKNEKGEYIGNAAIIRDNTELKKAELALKNAKDEAEFASMAKTQFLANMSHEIRSPLNAIIGFSQLLSVQSLKLDLPYNYKDKLDHIITAGRNLSELINNILDLSKIESGKLEVSLETINFIQLFQGIYHINKEVANKKNINYNFKYTLDVPSFIISDRTKLNQILMNLVSNAIKFTPENKAVTLEALREDDQLIIKVIDEGIGISKERKEKIFESFEQADNTITRKFGGTGLGLSISKEMVEMLEGKIWVESELGKGATFLVSLPIQVGKNEINLKQEWSSFDLQFSPENRILVAEDIELNQSMLTSLFDELNLKLEFANNGLEAIEKTKKLKPNLILMDIHMPDMDGLEATRKIRQIPEFKDLPIIALSADAFVEQQNKALELDVTEYITKPIDFYKLVSVLEKYLIKGEPEDLKEEAISVEAKNQVFNGLQELLNIPPLELKLLNDKIEELKNINGIENSSYRDLLDKIEDIIFSGETDSLRDLIEKEIAQIESV